MEIDEDSPDEDDRRALAALQDQEQMDEGTCPVHSDNPNYILHFIQATKFHIQSLKPTTTPTARFVHQTVKT